MISDLDGRFWLHDCDSVDAYDRELIESARKYLENEEGEGKSEVQIKEVAEADQNDSKRELTEQEVNPWLHVGSFQSSRLFQEDTYWIETQDEQKSLETEANYQNLISVNLIENVSLKPEDDIKCSSSSGNAEPFSLFWNYDGETLDQEDHKMIEEPEKYFASGNEYGMSASGGSLTSYNEVSTETMDWKSKLLDPEADPWFHISDSQGSTEKQLKEANESQTLKQTENIAESFSRELELDLKENYSLEQFNFDVVDAKEFEEISTKTEVKKERVSSIQDCCKKHGHIKHGKALQITSHDYFRCFKKKKKCTSSRPPFSYSMLIVIAIKANPNQRLQVHDIYDFIRYD